MHELSNIISYFRSCYQVDFKAVSVLNFFGKTVKDQLVIEGTEFLTGSLMQFPVDSVWGKEMENTLSYDSTEKALYACAFFLSGKMNVIGKSQKVFAPLFIYPVELLVEKEVYYLVLDTDSVVVNPVFVDFIKSRLQEGKFNYDDFAKHLPKGYLKFDEIHELEVALQSLVPELDVTSLDDYPDLLSKEELEAAYKKQRKNSRLSLLSGVGIGLVNKPTGARGILNELEQMAKIEEHSSVLKDLFFGESKKRKAKPEKRNVLTPVSLSPNQMKIFSSYDQHQLNLVVGPPGTGKSFTIAALAVDLISQGQSVLIASRNDQAGKVVADKIEKEFGLKGVVLRTSNRAFKNTLERRLKNIIYGFEAVPVLLSVIEKLEDEIAKLQTEIKELENTI